MEKFGLYYFKIITNISPFGFWYQILENENTVLRKAKEIFKYESIARIAAIGHISLLEQGKG